MSGHAVPFLSGFIKTSTARRLHLVMSYWSFVLMGVHLGMHLSIIANKLPKGKFRIAATVVMLLLSVYGFVLFFKSGIPNYMFMRVQFVFFDYEKSAVRTLLENLVMLISWAFAAYIFLVILKFPGDKKKSTRKTKQISRTDDDTQKSS